MGSDGNAYAWGRNNCGQLGDGTTTITDTSKQTSPVKVGKPAGTPTDFTYVQVSAGTNHSLALGSDGNAYAWGDNSYGRLGDGTTDPRPTPVKVSKPAGAPAGFAYVQVSAGYDHSLALGSDGYAYAWGSNNCGQLGDGAINQRRTPVKVNKPADTPTDVTYLQVSAGYDHSLAVGSDGNAYAWGNNLNGKLGDGAQTERHTPVKVSKPAGAPADFTYLQVSAACVHSVALGSDGYAYAWGRNDYGCSATMKTAIGKPIRKFLCACTTPPAPLTRAKD
ncbi:RCC1 domain-containing protein [Bifidobacterium sp. ESL0825]|uniref:RCC1 domain-containing protein n=1 Tax=Bifidobacterium sp. ESL0825 TaxID=3448587 RepID=UPI004041FB34